MQEFRKIFLVGAAFLAVCRSEMSAETNAPLSFYVVSDEKIEGGRFFDTNGFPRLGYIHAAPDLVITNLKAAKLTTNDASYSLGPDGKISMKPQPERRALWIALRPEDVEKFGSLTEKAFNKRVLMMLGDTPLMAPTVRDPISTGYIELSLPDNVDQKKIAEALEKLVTNNKPARQ